MSLGRRRAAGLVAVVAIAACGLLWRRPELGLPWTIAKYGGSLLWGAMVFCCVVVLCPRMASRGVATLAFAIAALVEASQLLSWGPLDAFRATKVGALLIGRTFDPFDIVAYAIGILAAAICASFLARTQKKARASAP